MLLRERDRAALVQAPVRVDDLAVLGLELVQLAEVLRLELLGREPVLDRLTSLEVGVHEIGEVDAASDHL